MNLVLNPDFELYSQCPTQFDQIGLATYWSAIDSAGNAVCTPEYCHTCGGQYSSSVPINQCFFQYPRSGNGFAQIVSYVDEVDGTFPYYRDHLLGRLSQILEDGKSYCVTFYVNFANQSQYFTDKVGAYLDDGSICNVSNCSGPLTQFTPQVGNTSGLITDTLNWLKIEGAFTSNGSERFITIGNFYDLANTQATPAYNIAFGYSWLLVEDVSVIESDLNAFAGPDTWVVEGDSVFIGRTPEVGLDCKWLVNGSVVDSGAGIWVDPTVTTTYVVEQNICGLTKTDTVIVSVFPASVNGIMNGKQLVIYPNPATNELHITCERSVFSSVSIVDGLGREVVQGTLTGKETTIDIKNLVPAVYFISLEGEKGREVRRFVKY